MNLNTPITFSETGKVKKYEMIQSQGNEMDVKALAYLQRPNLAINQQFTCIKTHQNFWCSSSSGLPLSIKILFAKYKYQPNSHVLFLVI